MFIEFFGTRILSIIRESVNISPPTMQMRIKCEKERDLAHEPEALTLFVSSEFTFHNKTNGLIENEETKEASFISSNG